MINFIKDPWPWYVAGPAIAFIMLFLLFNGRTFGFSSNLRTICSMVGAGKAHPFFDFNWRRHYWNLLFLVGAIIGGGICFYGGIASHPVVISEETKLDLAKLDIFYDGKFLPDKLFAVDVFSSFYMVGILFIGGFLIGFGSRYAGGCTSGHAISGLSNIQFKSLIAVVGFFVGGLMMTHLLFPLIF